MLREFIDRIGTLATAAAAPNKVDLEDGRLAYDKQVQLVNPPSIPTLGAHTLTAIVDYVKKNPDRLIEGKRIAFVHVGGHDSASLLRDTDVAYYTRDLLVHASCAKLEAPFPYSKELDQETFIIKAQSCFVIDDTLREVLKLVSGLSAERSSQSSDDGFSQTVVKKTGSSLVAKAEIKNPIVLRPFRTFRELEQPSSPFILRVHYQQEGLPTISLHEGGGQQWKVEAVVSAKKWLTEQLPDVTVIA